VLKGKAAAFGLAAGLVGATLAFDQVEAASFAAPTLAVHIPAVVPAVIDQTKCGPGTFPCEKTSVPATKPKPKPKPAPRTGPEQRRPEPCGAGLAPCAGQ